jgi:hypothetical protein
MCIFDVLGNSDPEKREIAIEFLKECETEIVRTRKICKGNGKHTWEVYAKRSWLPYTTWQCSVCKMCTLCRAIWDKQLVEEENDGHA